MSQKEWVRIAKRHGATKRDALEQIDSLKELGFNVDVMEREDVEQLWKAMSVLALPRKPSLWSRIFRRG